MATPKIISWTDEEKARLNVEAAALRAASPEMGPYELLRRAQEKAFKPARRRAIKNLAALKSWYVDFPKPSAAAPAVTTSTPMPEAETAAVANDRKPMQRRTGPVAPGQKLPWSTARKDGLARVRWSFQERADYAKAAAELYVNGAHGSIYEAMQAFNDTLPIERRTLGRFTAIQTPWLAAVMDPIVKALLKAKHLSAEEARQAQERAEREETQAAELKRIDAEIALAKRHQEAEERPPQPAAAAAPIAPAAPTGLGHLLGGLRQAVVEEIASIFSDAIRLAIGRQIESTAKATPIEVPLSPFRAEARLPQDLVRDLVPATPRAVHKPTVLVIGLRGAQMDLMKMEFGDRLDLRFHETNESKDALKSKAASADVTVGFTDFMSHSVEAIAKARSANYVRAGGGMTSLRSTLTNLAISQATQNGHGKQPQQQQHYAAH